VRRLWLQPPLLHTLPPKAFSFCFLFAKTRLLFSSHVVSEWFAA
jgi:hypothetical protein